MEGAGFGPMGIVALLVAFCFFSIGELGALVGGAIGGTAVKLLSSSQSDDSSDS
jgi:hypothetical protein